MPNTDMHHTSQLVLVTLGQAAICPLSLHSLSLSRPACQGKMQNAGLGKALFRKPHFLTHEDRLYEKRKHAHGCPRQRKEHRNKSNPAAGFKDGLVRDSTVAPKSNLPIFRLSDTLSKSSRGWYCYETVTPFRFLPPSLVAKG